MKKIKLTECQITIYLDEHRNILVKTPEGKYIGTSAWGLIYDESEVEIAEENHTEKATSSCHQRSTANS